MENTFMKNIRQLFLTLTLVCMSSNSWAVLIFDAGTKDVLLASTTLSNSSYADEEAWIESFLNFDIIYTKLDAATGESGLWEAVTDGNAGDFAFDFGSGLDIDYFLVKTGTPTGIEATHFLFDNLSSFQWAYVNLSDFGTIDLNNIGVISHVGTSTGTVPEPSTIVLLSLGLLGLGFNRRKRIY